MTASRSDIVAEARSWLGTRYRHAADVKGSGVDCGMILVRCFCDLGLTEPFDPRPYSCDWHLHQSGERYLGWVRKFSREVERPEPGDLVVWKIARCFAHGGIVTKTAPLTFVHAYAPARMVCEDILGHVPALAKRPMLAFSVF